MTALFHWIYCLDILPALLLTAGLTLGFLLLRHPLHRRVFAALCAALLAVWLGAVLRLTLLSRSPELFSQGHTLRPFASYLRFFREGDPELLRSDFMNILMFYPVGMLLIQLLPRRWSLRRRLLVTVAAACLTSAAIELTQYFASLGQLETDDLLHNTLGAFLGAFLTCPPPQKDNSPALTDAQSALLTLLKAALAGKRAEVPELSEETRTAVLHLAMEHKLLPLVLSALPPEWVPPPALKRSAFRQTAMQTQKSTAFLALYAALREAGCHPLVVKGILCRQLYPQGDLRPSNDEDLYVPDGEFRRCCDLLRQRGFAPTAEFDPDAPELGWRDGTLYIELHRHLFPPDSQAYGALNRFFPHPGAEGTEYPPGVYSLSHQNHLLYLLLHAYKHFLHSGFGIRQVCDICLWARVYREHISWETIFSQCDSLGAGGFAAALLGIGEHWLDIHIDLPPERRVFPDYCLPLLADILSAGVYGTAQADRLHSATVTLNAVEADNSGTHRSLLSSLLPGLPVMRGKYPYLNRYPILLPLAWLQRILTHLKGGGNAAASAAIGADRVALLRHYGILN